MGQGHLDGLVTEDRTKVIPVKEQFNQKFTAGLTHWKWA